MLLAGGHMTDTPALSTYANVVSREPLHIELMITALNTLKLMVVDIMNANIIAPIKEKIWTLHGPKFGKDCGQNVIVVRAIWH